MKRYVLVAMMLMASAISAQQPPGAPRPDPFAPIRFMVGTWKGENSGQPGHGTSDRTYAFEFGETFIVERNTGVYPPQPGNEKGETHRDTGFFSFDKARKVIVFR
jgi:hypothetical protein